MSIRVLFVCLGNICRSPAAEGIFRVIVPDVETDSAGTSGWHVGEPPYGPMQIAARARGVDLSDLRARPFVAADFERFDLVIGMDRDNIDKIEALRPPGSAIPVRLLTSYVPDGPTCDIPDPYYTRYFGAGLDLIEKGVRGLKQELRSQPQVAP